MNLTPKLADQIAKRYAEPPGWTNKTSLDRALAEVLQRHGGLMWALKDDARRDLILTLGEHRRAQNKRDARSRAIFAHAQERLSQAAE